MGIHWQELVIILLVVLVVFGPKRLPEIGSALGKGIRGFKDSVTGNSVDAPSAASITASAHVAQDAASAAAPVAIPVPVEVVDTDAAPKR